MRNIVAAGGLEDQVEIDSAGTISYHVGDPADSRMQLAAAKRGYQLDSIARQFHPEDFDYFDLILAMDRTNLKDIRSLDPDLIYEDQVRLFGSFLPGDEDPDVPDPYYGGGRGFDDVLDMMEQACPHILDHVLN